MGFGVGAGVRRVVGSPRGRMVFFPEARKMPPPTRGGGFASSRAFLASWKVFGTASAGPLGTVSELGAGSGDEVTLDVGLWSLTRAVLVS